MWGFRKNSKTAGPVPAVIEKQEPEPEPDPDQQYLDEKKNAALAYQADMRDKKYIETRDAQRKINEELSKLAENNLSYIDIVTTNLDTLKHDILEKYEAIQNKITTELNELVSETNTQLKIIDPAHAYSLIQNFNKNKPLKHLQHMIDKKIALGRDIESIKNHLKIYLEEPLYKSIRVASEGEQNYFSILGPRDSRGGSSRS